MVFFTEISRCIYECVTNIFWLYNCYFGKIKVCVVTKILLHGFHLQLIINQCHLFIYFFGYRSG